MTIRTDIDPKQHFPQSEYIIKYAFSVKDRHYFHFDDTLNIPYQRGLMSLVYYKELSMNVDRDFLKAHTVAVNNLFIKTQINIDDIVELKRLNNLLAARLELPKEPDLMYKMAAVVYFDQHENPAMYEFKYGESKIKHWKKDVTIQDFFLSKPLKELIPFLQHAGENLEVFLQMVTDVKTEHLSLISSKLSEEQKKILGIK